MLEQLGLAEKLALSVLITTMVIAVIFIIIDAKRKRTLTRYPFVSFMVPTHNDGKTVEKTIKSINNSYPKNKFEIIVIDDKSTDNTPQILYNLKKRYNLNIITNKENLGKTRSLNNAFKKTRGEIIFIVDSDTLANKEAINDLISRFESRKNLGGASCRYKVSNRKGFLPIMEDFEYNMLSFIQAAHNPFSTFGMWGGFMAFRRKAFRDIGGLSYICLTEDLDSAFALKEHGWKVEQSNFPVYTEVPDEFKVLYKQKLRWGGGMMQCMIGHFKTFIKNPLATFFMLSYAILAFALIFGFVKEALFIKTAFATNTIIWQQLFAKLVALIVFPLFSIPYIIYDKKDRAKFSRYFLIFPYALIYFPVFAVVIAISYIKVIFLYRSLKRRRAW